MNKPSLWIISVVIFVLCFFGEAIAQVSYQTDINGTTYETFQVDVLLIQRESGEWDEVGPWGSRPMDLQCHLDIACSTGVLGPLVVGVIIGAAANGIGAVIQGQNAGQVISATILGGVAGLFGGVATMTTGFGRVLWSANAIGVEGGVLGVVGRGQ